MVDLTTIHYSLRAYFTPNSAGIAIATCIAFFITVWLHQFQSRRPRTTKLKGPPSRSFLLGVGKDIFDARDLGAVYNDWEKTYGSTYEIAGTLGLKMLVLCDPKAIAHFFSKDTTIYHQLTFLRAFSRQRVSPDISVYRFQVPNSPL